MKLLANNGRTLNAELLLEATSDGRIEVVLESAGGKGPAGTSVSRNREYPQALETLLRRLSLVDTSLLDVLVDSRATRDLPPHDRRIHPAGWSYPIRLERVDDFDRLRKAITRPQAKIGSTAKGRGTERKRIRLTFAVPNDLDDDQVQEILRTVESNLPRRPDISEGLTMADVTAAIEEWRRIGRDAFLEGYGARPAHKYVVVQGAEEFDAIAVLRGARAMKGLDSSGPFRADRRAVADPLRGMGFMVDNISSDLEGPLDPDPKQYSQWTQPFSGDTDGMTLRSYRREQRLVRGALGIGTGDPDRQHPCGICGQQLPERLLAAAHLKPRRYCTEEERLDLPNIAMPACTLGCDALYEHGFLTVDKGGQILTGRAAAVDMRRFNGIAAPAWNTSREPYFAWHREHRFGEPTKRVSNLASSTNPPSLSVAPRTISRHGN